MIICQNPFTQINPSHSSNRNALHLVFLIISIILPTIKASVSPEHYIAPAAFAIHPQLKAERQYLIERIAVTLVAFYTILRVLAVRLMKARTVVVLTAIFCAMGEILPVVHRELRVKGRNVWVEQCGRKIVSGSH
jgi:hypothetical protein